MRAVLQGYDNRYERLVDWVTETEGAFDESILADLPVADLLIRPISETADLLADVCRDRAGPPLIGIGIDVVEIERFRRSLRRTPSMRERLFTAAELDYVASKADPVPSLAARFAAREAVMKSIGLGLGAFGFHEVSVERAASRARPR